MNRPVFFFYFFHFFLPSPWPDCLRGWPPGRLRGAPSSRDSSISLPEMRVSLKGFEGAGGQFGGEFDQRVVRPDIDVAEVVAPEPALVGDGADDLSRLDACRLPTAIRYVAMATSVRPRGLRCSRFSRSRPPPPRAWDPPDCHGSRARRTPVVAVLGRAAATRRPGVRRPARQRRRPRGRRAPGRSGRRRRGRSRCSRS